MPAPGNAIWPVLRRLRNRCRDVIRLPRTRPCGSWRAAQLFDASRATEFVELDALYSGRLRELAPLFAIAARYKLKRAAGAAQPMPLTTFAGAIPLQTRHWRLSLNPSYPRVNAQRLNFDLDFAQAGVCTCLYLRTRDRVQNR